MPLAVAISISIYRDDRILVERILKKKKKYDIEDEFMKYSKMLKSLEGSGEDELEKSIREKRKKAFDELNRIEKLFKDANRRLQ